MMMVSNLLSFKVNKHLIEITTNNDRLFLTVTFKCRLGPTWLNMEKVRNKQFDLFILSMHGVDSK